MISAGKVTGVDYYLDGVGGSEANYYLDAAAAQEPAGRWSGALAARLGLDGEVKPEDMRHLFETFEGPNGERLGNRPAQRATVEQKLQAWVEANPDALPEDLDAAQRRFEAGQRKTVLGWDLTFSVPKSVTVLLTALRRAELGAAGAGRVDEAARFGAAVRAVEAAVYAANGAAMEYVASKALAQVAAEGKGRAPKVIAAPHLAVASFLQHTSRSIQPQVHVHNVIFNKVLCADGEYRALDGDSLLDNRGEFSAVADADLEARLAALGIRMALRPDGKSREIVGVPEKVCDLFSERRKVITGRLAEEVAKAEQSYGRELTGHEVQRIARSLTVTTRAAKTHDGESEEELHARWQREAATEAGEGLDPLAARFLAQMDEAVGRPLPAETFSESALCAAAVAAVSERMAAWRSADLMREIGLRMPGLGGLSGGDATRLLVRLTEQTLAGPAVVEVSGREVLPLPVELRESGVAYDRPSARRFAATGSVLAEESLRQAAVVRGRFALEAPAVQAWLARHAPTAGPDQVAAIRGLGTTDAATAVLIGPAGTGKTYAVARLSEMWQELSGGGRVQGLAVSQQAAVVLAEEGVAVTANISAWLSAQERIAAGKAGPNDLPYVLQQRDLVLIDESSMVDRDQALAVQALVDRAGARLIHTGDPHQLAAVQAGGVMGLLDGHAEAYSLSEVRRFDAGWEAATSLRLREGDAEALAEYDRHGRITQAESLEAAEQAAARAALADILDVSVDEHGNPRPKQVLVVAGTNEGAARVAALIREGLVARGVVEEHGLDLARDGGSAGVGDQVMARKNNYPAGVVNRGRYRVASIAADGGLTVVDEDGQLAELTPEYVQEHLSSAYGSTVHAAQGVTVDRCHLVTDGQLDRQALYVALSRGRERNTAHVAVARQPQDETTAKAVRQTGRETLDGEAEALVVEASAGDPRPSGRAVLEDIVRRDGEAVAGLVALERDQARVEGMSWILGRQEDVVRRACRIRMESHLDRLAAEGHLDVVDRARLCAEQGTEHVSRLLRAGEQQGQDPEQLLRDAVVDRRGFDDARSVAQVLSSRITSGMGGLQAPTQAAIPGGLSEPVTRHLEQLEEMAQERRAALGSELAQDPPAWAVKALGPVPDDAVERLQWESNAGRVAGHREATGWVDEEMPLDLAGGVTSTERRAGWHGAWDALGQPEDTRAEAVMTEGQLRLRMEAWDRAKEWAPPYADESMRVAELDAELARQDGLLSEDDLAAERFSAEAAERAQVARFAERVALARQEWATRNAGVRLLAERAQHEWVKVRGLPAPGQEPDRVTPEEWLAADAEAHAVEDEHRTVTETDVHVPERAQDLSVGVQERAQDLSMAQDERGVPVPAAQPVRREKAAQQELPLSPSRLEMESYSRESELVLEKVADLESQERAATPLEDVEVYDTADGVYQPQQGVQQQVAVAE